jgi:hypothetical protein
MVNSKDAEGSIHGSLSHNVPTDLEENYEKYQDN